MAFGLHRAADDRSEPVTERPLPRGSPRAPPAAIRTPPTPMRPSTKASTSSSPSTGAHRRTLSRTSSPVATTELKYIISRRPQPSAYMSSNWRYLLRPPFRAWSARISSSSARAEQLGEALRLDQAGAQAARRRSRRRRGGRPRSVASLPQRLHPWPTLPLELRAGLGRSPPVSLSADLGRGANEQCRGSASLRPMKPVWPLLRALGSIATPLVLTDISTAGGLTHRWQRVDQPPGPGLRTRRTEPSSVAAGDGGPIREVIPHAQRHAGQAILHLTRKPEVSAPARAEPEIVQRYFSHERWDVVEEQEIRLTTLDEVLSERGADPRRRHQAQHPGQRTRHPDGRSPPDDRAGAHRGGGGRIHADLRRQPLFGDVDEFLEDTGFSLVEA